MSEIVDPLKFHTHGVKKPLDQKQENIQQLYGNQQRYYPTNKAGQVDEWGAVIQKQTENYQRENEEARVRKQFMQQKYSEDLQKDIQYKNMKKELERTEGNHEAQNMQRNLQLKAQLEMMERNQRIQRQDNLNNHFQKVIGYNNEQKNAMNNEQKAIDSYIVNRDLNDYDQYLKAQKERKNWQQQNMSTELAQSIALKNQIKEKERLIEKETDNYRSIGGVGLNYDLQKKRQQHIEEIQRQNQNAYAQQVSEAHRKQIEDQKQKEQNDFLNVRKRYDNEKEFIERQKLQARQLNYQQLQMQQNEQRQIKQLNDTNSFNKDQAQLQAHHNDRVLRFEEEQRKAGQREYKDMLDKQLEIRTKFTMEGNMSSVEKALNKGEMQAYKAGDAHQYALVPGLQHAKHENSPQQNTRKSPKPYEQKFAEKQQVLQSMGLHGIRKSVDGNVGNPYSTPLASYSHNNPITSRNYNHHLHTRNRVIPNQDYRPIEQSIGAHKYITNPVQGTPTGPVAPPAGGDQFGQYSSVQSPAGGIRHSRDSRDRTPGAGNALGSVGHSIIS